MQEQLKEPNVSVQTVLAGLPQAFPSTHSSIFLHCVIGSGANPLMQLHWKPAAISVHSENVKLQSWILRAHSSIGIQVKPFPVKNVLHWQSKLPTWFVQVAFALQGDVAHSSISGSTVKSKVT